MIRRSCSTSDTCRVNEPFDIHVAVGKLDQRDLLPATKFAPLNLFYTLTVKTNSVGLGPSPCDWIRVNYPVLKNTQKKKHNNTYLHHFHRNLYKLKIKTKNTETVKKKKWADKSSKVYLLM